MFSVITENRKKQAQYSILLCLFLFIMPHIIMSQKNNNLKKTSIMNVAVWDTYVKRKDGRIMHFDIIVPAELKDAEKVYAYGKEYLASKGENQAIISSKECRFCHVETIRPQWEEDIKKKGYTIYEMQNCD